MKREELAEIEAEVDDILDDQKLDWVRDEVDEHMSDAWPRPSPEATPHEIDRRRAARLVLTLGGLHRAARLALATEIALGRAQERHTAGVPWLVVDRDEERPLVTPSRGLSPGDRRAGVRDLGSAANGLAAELAEEFALPYRSQDLTQRAEQESALASERDDETMAWSAFVEVLEDSAYADADGTTETS